MSYYKPVNEATASVVKTVIDTISTGLDKMDRKSYSPGISRSSSLSHATNGLNIFFPVLVSQNNTLDTAMLISSKVVEKKAVTLLQIAFSAFNITNSTDATQFIKQFHTNLKSQISLDDFINSMDSYVTENDLVPMENKEMYQSVLEDLKRISYYYPEDINETSLNAYSVMETYNGERIIKEANGDLDERKFAYQQNKDNIDKYDRDMKNAADREYQKDKDDRQFRYQKDKDDTQFQYRKDMDARELERQKNMDSRMTARNNTQNSKDSIDMLKNQILTSDIKKANEAVPTMMAVNFIAIEGDHQIQRQIVIGVKAKLYLVDSQDVINKIVTKNVDKNIMLKFIKASTKEISFIKDFLFAIDNAKLNALSKSKKGSSTYALLKVLERRALGGKIRKSFKSNNAYKAIATLAITREEADEIYKYNNIDVTKPNVIRPIMEDLNLLMFIITDESAETVSILMDTGDDNFETISYTHLERETSDNSSRKIVNLISKMR